MRIHPIAFIIGAVVVVVLPLVIFGMAKAFRPMLANESGNIPSERERKARTVVRAWLVIMEVIAIGIFLAIGLS